MSLQFLKRTDRISKPIDEIWDFFSSPQNLKQLTPPEMNFEIIEMSREGKTYSGQIIKYRVNVLPMVRMTWVTEITYVKEQAFFVDEQRVGPYKIWHHEHHFREIEGGVEMTDVVSYQLPMGFLGRLALPMVRRKLEGIFDYRNEQVKKIFA